MRRTVALVAHRVARVPADAPLALVTGVGRSIGIGAAITAGLVGDGWRVATAGWRDYDERMPWGAEDRVLSNHEIDLGDPYGPGELLRRVAAESGPVSALVCCHCESVDSGILDTSVESFDRHMAVNARATWLLVKAFAEQLAGAPQPRRIVALTSDHAVFNLPYGASKGALDRIVLAAASELAHLEVTANVVNPGAVDTGWMDDDIRSFVRSRNLQPRIGTPDDAAHLVRFLCSPEGGWINGQLLHSDGGVRR
jgi:3-oxoacyl-[acyl-carrier protein] reductase